MLRLYFLLLVLPLLLAGCRSERAAVLLQPSALLVASATADTFATSDNVSAARVTIAAHPTAVPALRKVQQRRLLPFAAPAAARLLLRSYRLAASAPADSTHKRSFQPGRRLGQAANHKGMGVIFSAFGLFMLIVGFAVQASVGSMASSGELVLAGLLGRFFLISGIIILLAGVTYLVTYNTQQPKKQHSGG